jgi:hypothetical protein
VILRTGQPMPLEDDEARRLLASLPDTVRVVAAPEAETCGHEAPRSPEPDPPGCTSETAGGRSVVVHWENAGGTIRVGQAVLLGLHNDGDRRRFG